MDNQSKLIILGLIENERHEFLLSQRYDPAIPEAHLKWDLPGGKNDFGESLEDTAIREIFEETGLRVGTLKLLPLSTSHVWEHHDYQLHTIVLCFHCQLVSGKVQLGDHKIHDLKWVAKENLKDFEFLPTTRHFIDYLFSPPLVSR